MTDTNIKPRLKTVPKVARPPLHKVILVNDDFTPREFVVRVLKAEFRITEDQANRIMITAHTKGSASSRCSPARSPKPRPPARPKWPAARAIRCSSPPSPKNSRPKKKGPVARAFSFQS